MTRATRGRREKRERRGTQDNQAYLGGPDWWDPKGSLFLDHLAAQGCLAHLAFQAMADLVPLVLLDRQALQDHPDCHTDMVQL